MMYGFVCVVDHADVCLNVLNKYFEELCNISDLDSLLPHFEEESIITVHQQIEIENSNSPTGDKMRMLLDNISLPLQNGSTERFDSMLEILIEKSVDETKVIGCSMHREVKGIDLFHSVYVVLVS